MLLYNRNLLRTQSLSSTCLDLRHLVMLGPLRDGLAPQPGLAIAADLQIDLHSSPWVGGVVLGGSTERLQRFWSNALTVAKLCTYESGAALNGGPVIFEYLSLVDPQGNYLVYKCRKRVLGKTISYVFPEQIDRFAHGLTPHSWFQTPILAILAGQTGAIPEDYQIVLDAFFDYFDDTIQISNLLAYDHYDHQTVISEIRAFLQDAALLACNTHHTDILDIYGYWVARLVPVLTEHDVFLGRVLSGAVLHQHSLDRELTYGPFDLTPPPALCSRIDGRMYTLPNVYLGIAEKLERLVYTDFSATLACDTTTIGRVVVDYATSRFAGLGIQLGMSVDHSDLQLIFNQLHQLYGIHKPRPDAVIRELRIEKTFNEEAILEFYHTDSSHDHTIHVDFALLSYCSVGLGRFFNTAADQPS